MIPQTKLHAVPNYGDFSSMSSRYSISNKNSLSGSKLWVPSMGSKGLHMADPDLPPEVRGFRYILIRI
jgi:hypothetical protein